MLRGVRLGISIATLACACAACDSGRASGAECAQMIDKYVDMVAPVPRELVERDPEEARALRASLVRDKKGSPEYTRAMAQCEGEVSRREFRCAMRAQNPESWQACID